MTHTHTLTHTHISKALPHAAARCNTLQHTATHCNTHTHTHAHAYTYAMDCHVTSLEHRWYICHLTLSYINLTSTHLLWMLHDNPLPMYTRITMQSHMRYIHMRVIHVNHCNTRVYICNGLSYNIHRYRWCICHGTGWMYSTATHCNTLQYTATHICICHGTRLICIKPVSTHLKWMSYDNPLHMYTRISHMRYVNTRVMHINHCNTRVFMCKDSHITSVHDDPYDASSL